MINAFKVINTIPNYSINKLGIVIENKTNEEVKPFLLMPNNRWSVRLIINGKMVYKSVAYLLAIEFITIPSDLTLRTASIIFKDGNINNYSSLSNLEWKSKNYVRDKIHIDKLNKCRSDYNVPVFNNENTGYYPNAIECKSKPGYYFIPDTYYPLVISKEGLVFNLFTNEFVKPFLSSGYYHLSIRFIDKQTTIVLHRLLGRLFIAIPNKHLDKDINELEVNHIDGNKLNIVLTNLEWLTTQENNRHAIETGLVLFKHVLAKDIRTNQIIEYLSVEECARAFDIKPHLLTRRLANGKASYTTKNWHVFKYDDKNIKWPTLSEKFLVENRWDIHSGIWYARNVITKDIFTEDSLRKLATFIGININDLEGISFKDKTIVTVKGFDFYYDEEPDFKDYVKINPNNSKVVSHAKPVKVTNLLTLEQFKVYGLNEAARQTNVNSSTLSTQMIKKKGMARFDNYLYEYI